jgi:hypothetical protein
VIDGRRGGDAYLGKPATPGSVFGVGGSLLLSRVTSASIFCLKASYSGVPGRGGISVVYDMAGARCESGRGNHQCNQASHDRTDSMSGRISRRARSELRRTHGAH